MLEDFTMEKKPSSRSVQTPAKGCGTEVKKTQDTTNNGSKQFPRQSRRREPPNSKFDQNRKYASQKQNKSVNYDKRPKSRGQLNYGCGKANTQVVDELSEQFGLVTTSANVGGKKQSLNHLLNFHYAPRGEHMNSSASVYHRYGSVSGGGGGHYNNNSSARWLMSTHKHKYNKEQFLQANCQFVVRSDGDYTQYMVDPDMLVDWDLIEQVRVLSSEDVKCPICLDTPVAGKITRCGHVFCWPCMLHYLALSDKSWRKCPICYESVHRNDLKSVLVLLRSTYTVGGQITFQLMKRERGSMISSPVSQYEARTTHNLLSINENKLDIIYSKLLTADSNQVYAIIDKEMAELNAQLSESEGCPELCFIEQAIQLLTERKTAIASRINNNNDDKITSSEVNESNVHSSNSSHGNDSVNNNNKDGPVKTSSEINLSETTDDGSYSDDLIDNDTFHSASASVEISDKNITQAVVEGEMECDTVCIEGSVNIREARCRYISASSASEGEEYGLPQGTTITAEDLEINTLPNGSTPTKHFYFYQAMDGQQVFLHAVNVRMLEMTYSSLENCPLLITGKILEKEAGSMTDELRKRLRYLQHLPVTCQFEVAEIDLKPPVITEDTVELFKDQLELRKRNRARRARDERRREKKMVELVHKQYGRGPTPRLRIESLQHFPECGSELSSSPPSNNTGSNNPNETGFSRGRENVHPRNSSPVSSSRASSPVSVLSCSPGSSSTSLSFAQMLRDGKSTSGGCAWPTQPARQKQASLNNSGPIKYDSDNESNPIAAPQYRQSFSDAIATALEKATTQHDKDEHEVNSGKKKKRKQKVLLFATGMACNSK